MVKQHFKKCKFIIKLWEKLGACWVWLDCLLVYGIQSIVASLSQGQRLQAKNWLASFCKYLITVSPGVRASTLPFESYQRSDSTKFLSIFSTSYRDNLSTLQPKGYMIVPSEDGVGISLYHLRVFGQVPRVHFVAPTYVQTFMMHLPCSTSHSTGEPTR